MELLYKSTRSADKTVTASYAILKGLAEDGGLFVPTSFPKLDVSIDRLADMSYQEVAYEVMKLFLTDFNSLLHSLHGTVGMIGPCNSLPTENIIDLSYTDHIQTIVLQGI